VTQTQRAASTFADSSNIHKRENSPHFIELAKAVIETEITALQALPDRLGIDFNGACECILACTGRVIVTGMGKSGHIGNKIAATLASTGTPAFFVHPGEASHGDLGMITAEDVVIALSNSGGSEEILAILPVLKRLDIKLISLTGKPESELATASDYHLDIGVEKEACPLNLAPTSSTTTSLVMGDALAIALLDARGFTADDFARSHPGGRLGKRLLVNVKDLMHTGTSIPKVKLGIKLEQAVLEITSKGLGITTVINDEDKLVGLFTDGDLRRSFEKGIELKETLIDDVMITNFQAITQNELAVNALNLMEDKSITALPVTNDKQQIIGIIHMHDLLRSGIA
jgi:arabinose-5-phosphate isomerase